MTHVRPKNIDDNTIDDRRRPSPARSARCPPPDSSSARARSRRRPLAARVARRTVHRSARPRGAPRRPGVRHLAARHTRTPQRPPAPGPGPICGSFHPSIKDESASPPSTDRGGCGAGVSHSYKVAASNIRISTHTSTPVEPAVKWVQRRSNAREPCVLLPDAVPDRKKEADREQWSKGIKPGVPRAEWADSVAAVDARRARQCVWSTFLLGLVESHMVPNSVVSM